jgi:hypothetical protein
MRTIIVMITLGFLILFGLLNLGLYPDFTNRNKKALINNQDTCVIIAESHKTWFRFLPYQTTVMYKDNYGKYCTANFDEQLITIIPSK